MLISLSAGWGRFLLRHLVRARQAGGRDKGEDAGGGVVWVGGGWRGDKRRSMSGGRGCWVAQPSHILA